MSQPHAEPPAADVRSFLPRPGEAVEDYANRLRALHHDLTLVLDAVERGLAAAEGSAAPEPRREAAAVIEHRDVVEEPRRSPSPQGPLTTTRGSARVEVVSAPETAGGGGPGGDRSWSGPPEPEGSAPWGGRPAPSGEGRPGRGEPAGPSPQRSTWDEPQTPWVEHVGPVPRGTPWHEPPPPPPAPWQEPPSWAERRQTAWPAETEFEVAPHAPFAAPPRHRQQVPPVLVAALLLGWLTVIALGIALIFGL